MTEESALNDLSCTGRGVLYETLTPDGAVVLEDCGGSLQFDDVRVLRRWTSRGFHGSRVEHVALRFLMPDGWVWAGRGAGDNTIIRVRRTALRSLDD